MPHISIDLSSHPTVEATVTLSVTRLNDLLRILIDQANAHDQAIDQLKHQAADQHQRTQVLSDDLDKLRPDGNRLQALAATIEKAQLTMEKHRQELDGKIDATSGRLNKRVDAQDATLKGMSDRLENDHAKLDDRLSRMQTATAECKDRLDKLVIPDVRPLLAAVDRVEMDVRRMGDQVDEAGMFVQAWGPVDFVSLKGILKRENNAEDRVAFVHALPPMRALATNVGANLQALQQEMERNVSRIDHGLRDKANLSLVVECNEEAAKKHKRLSDDVEDLSRNVRGLASDIPLRLAAAEKVIEHLRHHKLDASALDLKADTSSLRTLATEVNDMHGEIEDLYEKLRVGGGHSGSTPKVASPAPPPRSLTRSASAAALIASNTDDLKKRIDRLDDVTSRLQEQKADKTDLVVLNDFLEALEHKVTSVKSSVESVAARTSPQRGGGGSGPSSVAPSRPPSGSASLTKRQSHTSVLAEAAGGRSPRPTSGGSAASAATAAPGSGTGGGPSALQATFLPIIQAATMFDATADTQSSPSSNRTSAGGPAPPKGVGGNSWHIGRGSISVRDSSGSCTPVTVVPHADAPPPTS